MASVLSNVWLVLAIDPEGASHRAVLGWSVWSASGNVGEHQGRAWLVVCAAVVCPTANP